MNLLVKSRSQSDYLASTNRSQPKQLPFSTFLVLYLLPRFFLAWILPPRIHPAGSIPVKHKKGSLPAG
jgi:hypothetical protein